MEGLFCFIVNVFFLGILSIYDLKFRVAPNYISLPYVLVGFVSLFVFKNLFVFVNVIELFLIFLVLFVYSKFRKMRLFDMFGGGDVKVLLGFSLINSFYVFNFSLVLSSIFGIMWGIIRKEKEIPFLFFLFLGYIVSYFVLYLFFYRNFFCSSF